MSIIKSITTSAKPFAIRGGRLRKRGGQVVSFAPYFADLMAGASRVAVGGALILSGAVALAPTSAMALPSDQRCEASDEAPNIIICSGEANEAGLDEPEYISVGEDDTTVTTAAGFGIDVSNTESFVAAITIDSGEDSDVSFTDENGSTIVGNGTGLLVQSNGGAIDIETNGIIDGGNADLGEDGSATWSAAIAAVGGNGVAITVAEAGEIKANALTDYAPDVADDAEDFYGDSFNASSIAAAVLATQDGAADLSLQNDGSLSSSATAESTVNLSATDYIEESDFSAFAQSTAAVLNQQGLGALTVNNGGDITSTASAILDHQIAAPYDDGGEDTTYVDDNDTNIFAIAGGISATHVGGTDTRVDPQDPIDTGLNIANAGNITVNAVADGSVNFDAYYNQENTVNGVVTSTAVLATRYNSGDISVSNTAAINSTAAFNTDVSFTADEYDASDNDLNAYNETNVTNLSSAVNVAAYGEDGVDSNIAINNAATGTISSTASFGGNILMSSGLDNYENQVNLLNMSSAVIANMFDNGALLINNDGKISSKAAFNGSITFDAADDVSNAGVGADVIATGVSANHFGAGDLTINNQGTISSEATINSVDENGDAINSINFAANDDISESGATVDLISTAIEAKHDGTGDINILNASGGKIISKATFDSNIGFSEDADIDDSGASAYVYATGINADHRGTGDITIVNDGDIEASISFAEALLGEDSNVYTQGYSTGIYAAHHSLGNIDIANAGSITGYSGISAEHFGSSGDITITATADSVINADDTGIRAQHYAEGEDGSILISNAGSITAADYGIYAENNNDGNVTVTNIGSITAGDHGIRAEMDSNGNVTVTNNGKITAAYHAIHVEIDGSTDSGTITVTNTGTVTSEYEGIFAEHDGVGDIIISNTGKITATVDEETATVDEEDADGEDQAYGIRAYQNGTGNISIVNDKTETATGSITGSTAAIYAEVEDGTITITNNGTLANSSGDSDAVAIIIGANSLDSTGSVAITNNGTLTGTINTAANIFEFEGDDIAVSFADTIVNNGTWNTAGGDNSFGDGEDSVTNTATGTLQAANASFYGLETLTNNGTLTLANGVAGDVLYTTGDVVLNEGGNLVLDVSAEGDSDTVFAAGSVTIDGGKLTLNSVGPRFTQGSTILIGATSITGDFDETNIEDTAFLDLSLTKMVADGEDFVEAGEDDLSFDRLDLNVVQVKTFAQVARTPNQTSVATALESMTAPAPVPEVFSRMATFAAEPVGNAMLDEILYLPTEIAANDAFDQLSGEAHATLRSNLAEDSRLVRNSILNRLQNREGTAVWGEMFYGAGDLSHAKNRNTGNAERDAWGFILGADTNVAENVTVGIAASLINHDNEQQSRNSKLDAETINLLAYVGVESGNVRFKVGTGYAWGDVDTSRSVGFGLFSDKLNANYDASQFQAFAEVGYRLPLGGGYVEPVASIAYIDTTTDAFAEKGGLAALTAEKRSESTTVSNLGARFSTAKTGIFSVNGMAGWHHSFGKLIPTSVMNFAGSDSFTVDGAAQSRNAAVAQLEAKFDVGETTSLSIGYDGMLGNAGDHHAVKASVRLKF